MRRFTCTLVFMFTLSSIFGCATLVFPSDNVYVCMRAYMYVYAHTPALQSFYLIIAGRDSLVLLSLDAPLVAPSQRSGAVGPLWIGFAVGFIPVLRWIDLES